MLRSNLFTFVIVSIALGDWYKKILVQFMSEDVLPIISSRSSMVSRLMFKSLSHLFEFIFMHGMTVCCSFIDLHAAVQLPQYHLLMRLCLFPIFYSSPSASLVKDWLIGVWVHFWAFHSVPLIHMSGFVPVPHCFDYCSFVVLSEVWEGYASCSIFPLDCFWQFWVFYGSI